MVLTSVVVVVGTSAVVQAFLNHLHPSNDFLHLPFVVASAHVGAGVGTGAAAVGVPAVVQVPLNQTQSSKDLLHLPFVGASAHVPDRRVRVPLFFPTLVGVEIL